MPRDSYKSQAMTRSSWTHCVLWSLQQHTRVRDKNSPSENHFNFLSYPLPLLWNNSWYFQIKKLSPGIYTMNESQMCLITFAHVCGFDTFGFNKCKMGARFLILWTVWFQQIFQNNLHRHIINIKKKLEILEQWKWCIFLRYSVLNKRLTSIF